VHSDHVATHSLSAVSADQCLLSQVNAHDDDADSLVSPVAQTQRMTTPSSPPPSFHSRASSPNRHSRVDPALADAFDDDASDDEADDRQLLVRRDTAPQAPETSGAIQLPADSSQPPLMPSVEASAAATRGRVMGGGIGTDGVFANMSARPERGAASEKDEQPPVGADQMLCFLPFPNRSLDIRTSCG
jgi:hypothetical protein